MNTQQSETQAVFDALKDLDEQWQARGEGDLEALISATEDLNDCLERLEEIIGDCEETRARLTTKFYLVKEVQTRPKYESYDRFMARKAGMRKHAATRDAQSVRRCQATG